MQLRQPPASVVQLRADLAVARSMNGKKPKTTGGGSTPGAGRREAGSGTRVFARSKSAPLNPNSSIGSCRGRTSRAGRPPTDGLQPPHHHHHHHPQQQQQPPPLHHQQKIGAFSMRSRSLGNSGTHRSAYWSSFHAGAAATRGGTGRAFADSAAGARFTPTKLELAKMRNELASDQKQFQLHYPIAPSPIRWAAAGGAPPPAAAVSPKPAMRTPRSSTSVARSVSRKESLEPDRYDRLDRIHALEQDIVSLRHELEAEKQHSAALTQQAREATSKIDAATRQARDERHKAESMRKKLEATAAQAVQDREEMRRRTASDISALKLRLEEADKKQAQYKAEAQVLRGHLATAARASPVPSSRSSHLSSLLADIDVVDGDSTSDATEPASPGGVRPAGVLRDSIPGGHAVAKNRVSWSSSIEYREPSPLSDRSPNVSTAASPERTPPPARGDRHLSPSSADEWTPTKPLCGGEAKNRNNLPSWLATTAGVDVTPSTDRSSDEEVDADLKRDLRDMFMEYDTDHKGVLPRDRVRTAFIAMERTFGLKSQDIVFPDSSEDLVDFSEFVRVMSVLPTRLATELP
ncbi:hypothetical protein DIPPA_12046 [Diplonema papillatum]|nr:hypothetical protein DIPPA_12046 [Diplonema papillatum]